MARRRRGQALVIAILALTALTASAISLSVAARVELRAARRGVDTLRRETALRGAGERGIALLESARSDPAELLSLLSEHRGLRWTPYTAPTDENETPLEVAIQIADASSRLNVNAADQEQLEKLPGMDKEAAAAMTAWRDERNDTQDVYYRRQPHPYESRKRPFDTLEELLLVRNVTASAFFGEPSAARTRQLNLPPVAELLAAFSGENNTDGAEARVNVNEGTADELQAAANRSDQVVTPVQAANLVQQREQRRLTQGAFRSVIEAAQAAGIAQRHWGVLIDAWTADRRTFLPGRVNVNTAPPSVLKCLPGITEELAENIVRQRRENPAGLDWPGLLKALGAGGTGEGNPQQPNQQQQDVGRVERVFSVRSAVYLVRCLLREHGSTRVDAVSATVYLPPDTDDPARTVQWRRCERYPGWTAWYRPPGSEE